MPLTRSGGPPTGDPRPLVEAATEQASPYGGGTFDALARA
jgi:hypothetical protein